MESCGELLTASLLRTATIFRATSASRLIPTALFTWVSRVASGCGSVASSIPLDSTEFTPCRKALPLLALLALVTEADDVIV